MDPTPTTAAELKLRDTVSLTLPNQGTEAYMTATVYKIKDDKVHLWRPYVTTTDFETTAGVIPYIGIETVVLWVGDTRPLLLLTRENVR